MKQITIVLDETQIKKVDEIAKKFRQSRNFVIREAINTFLGLYFQSKSRREKAIEVDKTLL